MIDGRESHRKAEGEGGRCDRCIEINLGLGSDPRSGMLRTISVGFKVRSVTHNIGAIQGGKHHVQHPVCRAFRSLGMEGLDVSGLAASPMHDSSNLTNETPY